MSTVISKGQYRL